MDIKINGNLLLDLEENTIPNSVLTSVTSLFIKDTPNTDARSVLDDIISAQTTADSVVLSRIRIDIGTVSDTAASFAKYASFAGFNDNYEQQSKPRLVGNLNVSQPTNEKDYTTIGFDASIVSGTSNLSQQSSVFDGLTITIPDASYIKRYAIQTKDSQDVGYNPYLALLVKNYSNSGFTIDSDGSLLVDILYSLSGNTSNWYLRKTYKILNGNAIYYFISYIRSTLEDTNNIVIEDPGQTWTFDNVIDYEDLNVKEVTPQKFSALVMVGFRTTVKYYFPKTWFALHFSDISPGTISGDVIGTEYYFRGTLSDFIQASWGDLIFSTYMNATFAFTVPDIYIVDDNKEIGDYTASEINACFDGLTSIPAWFMASKAHITALPNDTDEIQAHAFCSCANAVFQLPSTITKIQKSALNRSGVYGDVNLPSLTVLDADDFGNGGAFQGTAISSVTSLGSITKIGNACFKGCTSLQTAVLPSTITTIAAQAFYGCTQLTSVTINATTPPTLGNTNAFGGCSNLAHIYVPSASVSDYQSASNWSSFSSIISAIPS